MGSQVADVCGCRTPTPNESGVKCKRCSGLVDYSRDSRKTSPMTEAKVLWEAWACPRCWNVWFTERAAAPLRCPTDDTPLGPMTIALGHGLVVAPLERLTALLRDEDWTPYDIGAFVHALMRNVEGDRR